MMAGIEGEGKKDQVEGRKMSTEGGEKTDIGEITTTEIVMVIEDMGVARVTWFQKEKKSIMMKEVHLIDNGMNVNVVFIYSGTRLPLGSN